MKVYLNGAIYTLSDKKALIDQLRLNPEAWLRQLIWDGSFMKLLRIGVIKSNVSASEQLEAWDNTCKILDEGLNISERELDGLIETPIEDQFNAIRKLLMQKV